MAKTYNFEETLINNKKQCTFLYSLLEKTMYSNVEVLIKDIFSFFLIIIIIRRKKIMIIFFSLIN